MNENFQYSEYPDHQSALFNYDWIPNYQVPFEFVNAEVIPDPLGPSDRVNAKVAIPRNAPPINPTSSGRVSRACENCREQKAKCSGHRPACHRCRDSGVQCSYGDRKREKMVKWVTIIQFSLSLIPYTGS